MVGIGGIEQKIIGIETNNTNTMKGVIDNNKSNSVNSNITWENQSSFLNVYTHKHNGVFHFIYDSKLYSEYMVRLNDVILNINILIVY